MMPCSTSTVASGRPMRRWSRPPLATMPPKQDGDRDDRQRVVAREERDQDAGVAVAGDQRGVGAAVDRRDLDHAGEPGAGAGERAGGDDQLADRQALQPARRAGCRRRCGRRSRRWCAPSARQAAMQATMPKARPQCTSSRESLPSMLASPIGRVDGLLRLAGSRSGALDEMVHDRDGDVGQQQAGDRLVDAAVVAQRAGQRRSRAPPTSAPASAMASQHARAAAAPSSGTATAAAARPPSTSAPSPPIIIRPSRAGSATHSAVRISGAARCSVFWSENQVPKPPRYISAKNSSGDLPWTSRNSANSTADSEQRQHRDGDRLRPPGAGGPRGPRRMPGADGSQGADPGRRSLAASVRLRTSSRHALDQVVHRSRAGRRSRRSSVPAGDRPRCPCCP